jgi:hypothetical protein
VFSAFFAVKISFFDRIYRIIRMSFFHIVRQGGSGVSPLAAGTRLRHPPSVPYGG